MKKINIFRILLASTLAISALVLSYVSTNLNVSLSGEKTVLKYWRAVSDWVTSGREQETDDNVIFIDVAHDKQLVDIADEFGIPVGNAAITDRQKLYQLLHLIDSSQTYQYVMLDVFFEEGFMTEIDNSLFALISGMDRLVIPRHDDGVLADLMLHSKAAYADYTSSINENDFTKYSLFRKDAPSMPLRTYEEISNHTVTKRPFWYSDGGRLSRKVVFPKMHVRAESPYRPDGQKTYLNLGVDIIDCMEDVDWTDFFKEKFIVVGSFEGDDIHTTYAGDVPGCLINYNVLLSLMKGQHKIPLSLIIVYFMIFFAMAYLLLRGDGEAPQSWTWIWTKLFVLYSVVLTIVCIFVFMIWGQAHDIFITSTFFSIVDLINRRIHSFKMKNNA